MADLRMIDLNKVMIAGRLTRDPELKYIGNLKATKQSEPMVTSTTALCTFGMAVSHKYKDKQGELQEDTVFVNVTCWGKTAEYVGENFNKGRAVMVEGRLKSDEWETQGGEKRNKLSITADRVQSMQWDDDGGKPEASKQEQQPEDESDIPF